MFFKVSNTSFEFLEFVASDKVTFRKYHHFHTPLNCSTIFYTNKLLFLEFPLKYAELGELNWIEQNWCFKISSCSIKLQSFYRKITRNHMMIIFSSGCLKKLFNFVEGLKKISGIFHKGEAWFSTKTKNKKNMGLKHWICLIIVLRHTHFFSVMILVWRVSQTFKAL